MMKPTKKLAAPISKPAPGFSTPRVYKPALETTSLSTSPVFSKERKRLFYAEKQTNRSKVIAYAMSLPPSASDPTSLTSTRMSLITERMGDKDIVKRAFKAFQKSYDFTSSVEEQIKQNHPKDPSVPLAATRQKENARPTKSSHLEKISGSSAVSFSSYGMKSNNTAENKQKEVSKSGATPVEKTRLPKNSKAGVIDAEPRETLLNRMQNSCSVLFQYAPYQKVLQKRCYD